MASPKTACVTEKTRIHQAKILELKRDNPSMTFEAIGEKLGLSRQRVHKIYHKALKAIIQEPAEDVIKMELARLDELQTEVLNVLRSFHPVINQGQVVRDVVDGPDGKPVIDLETGKPVTIRLQDSGPKLAAVDRALKIMERRAKFLGLDKVANPEKEGLTPEEFASKVLGVVHAIDEISGGRG